MIHRFFFFSKCKPLVFPHLGYLFLLYIKPDSDFSHRSVRDWSGEINNAMWVTPKRSLKIWDAGKCGWFWDPIAVCSLNLQDAPPKKTDIFFQKVGDTNLGYSLPQGWTFSTFSNLNPFPPFFWDIFYRCHTQPFDPQNLFRRGLSLGELFLRCIYTVDGRNLKQPAEMYNIPVIYGINYYQAQLVSFHGVFPSTVSRLSESMEFGPYNWRDEFQDDWFLSNVANENK